MVKASLSAGNKKNRKKVNFVRDSNPGISLQRWKRSNDGHEAEANFVGSSRPDWKIKVQKNGSFSLIERVILSAGAMLIFSVSFQIDQMPEGEKKQNLVVYIDSKLFDAACVRCLCCKHGRQGLGLPASLALESAEDTSVVDAKFGTVEAVRHELRFA